MTPERRRVLLVVAVLLLVSSVLTACTVSLVGGLAGGLVTFGLTLALLGLGASTSGCETTDEPSEDVASRDLGTVGPCLSLPAPDTLEPCLDPAIDVVGPCLSPPYPDDVMEPCLSPPYPDDVIGPCLSPPYPDDVIGPCLSPPLPSDVMEPCLSPPLPGDVMEPCLSLPEPGESASSVPAAPPAAAGSRAEAVLRVLARGGLPSDVAARLSVRRERDES